MMTDERRAELKRYFVEQELPCGCTYLGAERSSVCYEHDSGQLEAVPQHILDTIKALPQQLIDSLAIQLMQDYVARGAHFYNQLAQDLVKACVLREGDTTCPIRIP